jgi:DNA repair ATPase RecN
MTTKHASPLDALTTARDQIRVDLHLLSMDARQKWDELDAKILALEGKIGAEAETFTEATAKAATDLSSTVKDFIDVHVRNIKR